MASLKNRISNEIIYLNNQHTFGRNQHTSNTYLPELDISQFHAIISWKGNGWYIQDNSRNGTLVNGKYLNNANIEIVTGDIIQFGEQKSTQWEVMDSKSPASYFKSTINPNKVIELDSCFAFPNEENPEFFVYPSEGSWKLERNGAIENLIGNQIYTIDSEDYIFIENSALEDTMDIGSKISDAYLQFTLSADEEHISIKIIIKNHEIDLGERVHNYILLALARKRLADHEMGYTSADQGWMAIDELLSELSRELNKEIDIYYLNLKIHRIRKLLLDIKPYGHLFSNIIERRPKEVRLTHPYFQILKEGKSIGEISFS